MAAKISCDDITGITEKKAQMKKVYNMRQVQLAIQFI